MRHGPAIERDEWRGDDDSRPLSPEGLEKTRDAARGLINVSPVIPQLVASSPKRRAVQTAEFVCGVRWPKPKPQLELWPELASDHFSAWLERLRASQATSVLLVGHEPDLSRFASLVLALDADAVRLDFKKASVLALELDPATGRATLQWMALPRVLRALGSG